MRKRRKEKRKEQIQDIISRGGEPDVELPRKKRKREDEMELGEQRIVIDCAFDDLMNKSVCHQNYSLEILTSFFKEIGSLCSQLVYCHGRNRKQEKSFQVFWTNFGGRLKEAIQNIPGKNHSWIFSDFFSDRNLTFAQVGITGK
jgi:hypothetical protein